MSKSRAGWTLGTWVFLSTGLVLLAALGAAVAATSLLGERSAVREARARIAASASVQTVSQQQRYQQLGLLAEIMASKTDFKAGLFEAVGARDRLRILHLLDQRQSELGFDLAIVVDAGGALAARTDQREVAGVDLSARPLFQRVGRDFEAAGVWSEGGRLYEAVAVPMALDDGLFGFLALGYAINDVRALEIKRGTGSETLFLPDPQSAAVATSMTPEETGRLLAALRAEGDPVARIAEGQSESVQQQVLLGGERWLAQLRPLRDAEEGAVGAAISLVSLDREFEGYGWIRTLLLAVGGGALIAALLVSILLGRRVTRPIEDLVRATGAAREGRYDAIVPPRGTGEVRALAGSWNDLLVGLGERREMAEYFEQLARKIAEGGGGWAGAAGAGAVRREVAFLGVELRRHLALRAERDAGTAMERLNADLSEVDAAVSAHGGAMEALHGHRVLASFSGAHRSERALAVAAEVGAVLGRAANALDQVTAPASAIAIGEIVGGTVRWGESGGVNVMGRPLQQVEALLREAGDGEILLAPAVHSELAGVLKSAGISLRPYRGLLSSQPLYQLSPEQASAAAAAGGQIVSQRSASGALDASGEDERTDLAEIGPGTLLGSRFEILATLGSSGTGTVYRARDRELGELVALKLLRRDAAGGEALTDRLRTELEGVRRIAHPNVLRLFDFGDIDGRLFLSMESIRGATLRAMIEQCGRLSSSAGIWIGRQLLSGLAAAHTLGIVHRDIRPENMLIDSTGSLKLMEFGLARPVNRTEPGQIQADRFAGTPHYLAPEQIEGEEPDKRADVYACGVVLYELFTGELPFRGATALETLSHVIEDEPRPPRAVWPEIPAALEAVILRALAKKASSRPRDAMGLLEEFERCT